jgi:MoaA/NifB/PqqE/SkfB family radical SAM enzyme
MFWIIREAAKHLRSLITERLYLAWGVDWTRPITIRGTVNERCNYRCAMCLHWRPDLERPGEMTIQEWIAALRSLRMYVGRFKISLTGGEPFLKKGFVDLLEFCAEEGIDHSTTTNGSLLSGPMVRRYVATRPRFLNVSVDGPTPEIHDRSRGVRGSLQTIERAIACLHEEQSRQGVFFPIRIKATLHAENFRVMPGMVEWLRRVGASTVDFEPVRHWSPEVDQRLWIETEHLEELGRVVEELLRQKLSGAPIETSAHRLSSLPAHFARLPIVPEVTPCRIGLQDYHIRPNGDVLVCWFMEPIGNVRRQQAQAIWEGALAQARRLETVTCTKACAFSCQAKKPLGNLIDRGLLLLTQPAIQRGKTPS